MDGLRLMKPDYFPESFPREDFPQYVWTEPPKGLPSQIWTTETTHRDGQQGGAPFDPETGIRIYELLCRFTNDSGAIRQAEFFVYHPNDRAVLEAAGSQDHRSSRPHGSGRPAKMSN
jgi:hypothetical protein